MSADLNAHQIIQALGGNFHTGMCRCPAHNDKHPSLHISEENGKVLWKCFAGCSQDAVRDALKARGLLGTATRGKFVPDPEKSPEFEYALKLREAFAILRAAAGARGNPRDWVPSEQPVEYLKGRGLNIIPKAAMLLPASHARRLTGYGYPIMALPIIGDAGLQGAHCTLLTRDVTKNLRGKDGKNMRRVYGLKKGGYIPLVEPRRDRPLIMAEGVENALAASELTGGLPAIAALSADNFDAVLPPPCSELIIAGDNDKNGLGREKAEAAATRLSGPGRPARVAIPKDFKDWNIALCKSPDAEQLGRSILRGKRFKGSGEVRALGMEQFMGLQFPPRQFLLKPWLTTTGLTMIDAPAGHGKTWLALSVAYAVASGQSFLEWMVERRGKVLYVDGELPGELLQKRLSMLGATLSENDFVVLSRSQFEMHGALMPDLGQQEGRDYVDAEIERLDIDLVILDSVTTLVRSGVENDVESWRAIQDWSLRHRARGRAVIYLHHHGRSKQPRGTSAREVVLDARISLERNVDLTTDSETAFKLEFPKAREFHGADAAPMIAYLSTQSGVVEWRRESVRDNTRDRIADLVKQGWKQVDIAKKLELTEGRVSQVIKELKTKADVEKSA